jgi:hypothetical protein
MGCQCASQGQPLSIKKDILTKKFIGPPNSMDDSVIFAHLSGATQRGSARACHLDKLAIEFDGK